jgi:hypothetical protein
MTDKILLPEIAPEEQDIIPKDYTPIVAILHCICADDSLAIIHYILDDKHGFTRELTVEGVEVEIARFELAWSESKPHKVPIKEVTLGKLEDSPKDRIYRNAWHKPNKDGPIEIHVGRAKEIHRNHLREARTVLLAQLDVEYIRAHEQNDTIKVKQIVDRKNKLRDITKHPDIDNAQTVDDLKKITVETHGA